MKKNNIENQKPRPIKNANAIRLFKLMPKLSFERIREGLQRQILADPKLLLIPNAKIVGTAISWSLNLFEPYAFPGMAKLANRTGLSTRTVRRMVVTLERAGHLWVKRGLKPGSNHRHNNQYTEVLTAETTLWILTGEEPAVPTGLSPGKDKAVSLGKDKAVSQYLPTILPTTSPIPIRTSDAPNGDVNDNKIQESEKEDNRERDEGKQESGTSISDSTSSSESQPSLPSICFDEAEEHWGRGGRAVTAKALNITCIPPEECLADIRDVFEEGGTLEELAMRLWRP